MRTSSPPRNPAPSTNRAGISLTGAAALLLAGLAVATVVLAHFFA